MRFEWNSTHRNAFSLRAVMEAYYDNNLPIAI